MTTHSDPIVDLADMAQRYYDTLRQRGIPQSLAERLAGDWHQAVLQAAIGLEQEKVIRAAQQVTRNAVRGRS